MQVSLATLMNDTDSTFRHFICSTGMVQKRVKQPWYKRELVRYHQAFTRLLRFKFQDNCFNPLFVPGALTSSIKKSSGS